MSTRSLKALILAGGKGTRLRPLTYAMAKQLVPVANRPILFYALDELYEAGIREFGIIISPETGEDVKVAVYQWQPHDTQVSFILQDQPLGLAHAVKIAYPFLGDDDFVMYLGDNLLKGPLLPLIQDFKKADCAASILLKEVPNPSSFGVAEVDENQHVIRLMEKPKDPPSNLALVGVYLFTAEIFKAIDAIQPSPRGELEITDAIQYLIEQKQKVQSKIHQGWWLDTGKKDDLLSANQVVLQDYVHYKVLGSIHPTSQFKGEIELDANSQIQHSSLEGPVRIGKNCKIINSTIGPFTSIGDGCEIINCHIENSVILEGCQLQNIPGSIQDSLIGRNCRIYKSPQEVPDTHQFLLVNDSEVQLA